MKKSRLFFLFIVMVFLLFPIYAIKSDQFPNKTPNEGDYLSINYISYLRNSHSTLSTLNIYNHPQLITVKKEHGIIIVSEKLNWHEGCVISNIEEKKSKFPTAGDCPDGESFTTNGENEITIHGEIYKLVKNYTALIADIVIGGKYVDKQGERYVFSGNGIASFPGKSFKYELCLDQTVPPCAAADMFYAKDSNTPYAFKRLGNSLIISKAPEDEFGEVDFANPLLTLERKGDAQ